VPLLAELLRAVAKPFPQTPGIVLTSKGQQEAIVGLERANELVTAPLLRLEHALH